MHANADTALLRLLVRGMIDGTITFDRIIAYV